MESTALGPKTEHGSGERLGGPKESGKRPPLRNSITLILDDGTAVCMYADGSESTRRWADALHVAVWNRPFPFV